MTKTWELSTANYITGYTSAAPDNPTSVGSGLGRVAVLNFSWAKSFNLPAGEIKGLGVRFGPTSLQVELPFRIVYSYGEMIDARRFKHVSDLLVSWDADRQPTVPAGVTCDGRIVANSGWDEEHRTYVVSLNYWWYAVGYGQQHETAGYINLYPNGSVLATGDVVGPLSAVVPKLGTYLDEEASEIPAKEVRRERHRALRLEPETVAAALAREGEVLYLDDDRAPGERVGGAHVDDIEKVQKRKEKQLDHRRAEHAVRPAPSAEDLLDKQRVPWRFDVEKNAWFMAELEVEFPTAARSIRNYNRLAGRYAEKFADSDLKMMVRLLEGLARTLQSGGDRVATLGAANTQLLELLTGRRDKGKDKPGEGEGEGETKNAERGWRPEDFLAGDNPLVLTLPEGIDLWPGAEGVDSFLDKLQEYNRMARRNWDLFDPQAQRRMGSAGKELSDEAMNRLRGEARSMLTSQLRFTRGSTRNWVHKDVFGAAVVEVLNQLGDGKPSKPLDSEFTIVFILYAGGDVQRRFHTFDDLRDAFQRAEIAIPGVIDQLRKVMARPKELVQVRVGNVVGDAIFGSDLQSIVLTLDATYDESTSSKVLEVLTESRGVCFYMFDRGVVLLSATREFGEYDGTVIKLLKFAGWQTGEIRRVTRWWPNKDYFAITPDPGSNRDTFDKVAKFITSQEQFRDREIKPGEPH
ncbi:hypothetical protein SAMN05192558_101267 [Actinokineospora alba]|uniref:Uncharacterized protein n=1 Tax=Actinokineospora alba TaxID=504798 RepID=A0A1H0F7T5_9PSEU|nr:hypothetical protein [Actinokineospora alba]TDP69377.1 hypothetical protein C8E96_4963 [Actinokineospora alba]SDI18030.1 hypothetical protein SAMN05421871_103603 [Actinokineospora alba]SDN90738.1 hypothetical protein SAMN05192558_101267 [Actinokineospora alba]